MKERRKDYPNLITKLAVIEEKINTIEKTVEEIKDQARANSDSLLTLGNINDSLEEHKRSDSKWFSVITTGVIGIFIKVVFF